MFYVVFDLYFRMNAPCMHFRIGSWIGQQYYKKLTKLAVPCPFSKRFTQLCFQTSVAFLHCCFPLTSKIRPFPQVRHCCRVILGPNWGKSLFGSRAMCRRAPFCIHPSLGRGLWNQVFWKTGDFMMTCPSIVGFELMFWKKLQGFSWVDYSADHGPEDRGEASSTFISPRKWIGMLDTPRITDEHGSEHLFPEVFRAMCQDSRPP